MDDNSVTELLVVALFGGAAGAVITALVQTRHDRRERMRDRMLAAADDFLAAVLQVVLELSAAQPGRDDSLPKVTVRIEEMILRHARVRLLFGYDTPAGVAADEVFGCLLTAQKSLRDPPPDYQAAARAREKAVEAADKFMRAANEALVQTWGDRFVRTRAFWWARRRVSRLRDKPAADAAASATTPDSSEER